jgi:hypothetical protein
VQDVAQTRLGGDAHNHTGTASELLAFARLGLRPEHVRVTEDELQALVPQGTPVPEGVFVGDDGAVVAVEVKRLPDLTARSLVHAGATKVTAELQTLLRTYHSLCVSRLFLVLGVREGTSDRALRRLEARVQGWLAEVRPAVPVSVSVERMPERLFF